MTKEIMQSYLEVEKAMTQYNTILEEHVASLRATEPANSSKVERMQHGARAMRDSSMIYLSYAKFIAYGMPESEDLVEDDLQGT